MTRFARAKGSKASNERKEENPTPWHVMRQQFSNQISKINLQENECSMRSIKKDLCSNSGSKQEEVWSDFCKINKNKLEKTSRDLELTKKINKKFKLHKTDKNNVKNEHSGNTFNDLYNDVVKIGSGNVNITEVDSELKKSKKVKNHLKSNEICIKKKKIDVGKQYVENKLSTIPINKSSEKQKCFKSATSCIKKSDSKLKESSKNRSLAKSDKTELGEAKYDSLQHNDRNNKKHFTPCSNKKIPNKAFTIIANGREIKVVNFEGFFIKKDDAKDLKKMRNKLRAENIPKEQIKTIMKLQRRKAEKALAREKNNVCFHCRKFGHNFTDCPDIKDSEMSKSGMCFKCGSMEHSYFQCKVLQSQDFRYAICFVCKEQGHIARQCPLNPQGQYPKGGSCHVCGEVTHLRKDCPKAVDKKPSNTYTVDQLRSEQLEDLSETSSLTKKINEIKNKVVKF